MIVVIAVLSFVVGCLVVHSWWLSGRLDVLGEFVMPGLDAEQRTMLDEIIDENDRRNRTGFDRYFDERMEDPEFAAGYEEERAKLKTNLEEIPKGDDLSDWENVEVLITTDKEPGDDETN